MIIGTGIDIVDKYRIKKILKQYNTVFYNKLCNSNELQTITQITEIQLISFLAKRFAAKEAVAKAIGCGIGKHLSLLDIEISNLKSGEPIVKQNSRITAAILHCKHETISAISTSQHTSFNPEQLKIHISISDEQHTAISNAIIEYIQT